MNVQDEAGVKADALGRHHEHGLSATRKTKGVRQASPCVRVPLTDLLPDVLPGNPLDTCRMRDGTILKLHDNTVGPREVGKLLNLLPLSGGGS